MADPLTVASLVEKHEKNHDSPEKKSTCLEPPPLKIPLDTISNLGKHTYHPYNNWISLKNARSSKLDSPDKRVWVRISHKVIRKRSFLKEVELEETTEQQLQSPGKGPCAIVIQFNHFQNKERVPGCRKRTYSSAATGSCSSLRRALTWPSSSQHKKYSISFLFFLFVEFTLNFWDGVLESHNTSCVCMFLYP